MARTRARLLAEAVDRLAIKRPGRPVAEVRGREEKPPRTFFDTNVLVYAEDSREPEKRKTALALILEHRRRRTGVVSLQVLQEFFVTATLKLKLDPVLAREKVEFHARFQVVEPAVADILAAIDFHRLYRVSYWDALVLHSARQSGCSVLLTEDMQDGQIVDGVRIVNPFI
ncbi:MAG TPA: PIN domain-containing protein [Terracidiphilus sp.]|nr:PIN domain-containing protein [Terracidiphilus sp.]